MPLLCRAAENSCFVASVNYATPGSATTSAIVGPDGAVLAWQPYGQEGMLVVALNRRRLPLDVDRLNTLRG